MSDWLHCNTCYKQPGDGRGYFLTNCGHLYCESCQSKGWKETCLLCGTCNPSALKLTSKLTPPVEAFFSDPIKMMKQIYSNMKQLISTSEFQHHQRKRYVVELQKRVSHQRQVVEQHERELKANMRVQFDAAEREMNKLREENSYLKRLISEKGHGSLRSPICDRQKFSNSPVQKAYGSPSSFNQVSRSCSTSSLYHKKPSPCPGVPMVTSGRISVITPPYGCRIGAIPQSTPSPRNYIRTPKSVPHPIGFDVNMETPTR